MTGGGQQITKAPSFPRKSPRHLQLTDILEDGDNEFITKVVANLKETQEPEAERDEKH